MGVHSPSQILMPHWDQWRQSRPLRAIISGWLQTQEGTITLVCTCFMFWVFSLQPKEQEYFFFLNSKLRSGAEDKSLWKSKYRFPEPVGPIHPAVLDIWISTWMCNCLICACHCTPKCMCWLWTSLSEKSDCDRIVFFQKAVLSRIGIIGKDYSTCKCSWMSSAKAFEEVQKQSIISPVTIWASLRMEFLTAVTARVLPLLTCRARSRCSLCNYCFQWFKTGLPGTTGLDPSRVSLTPISLPRQINWNPCSSPFKGLSVHTFKYWFLLCAAWTLKMPG